MRDDFEFGEFELNALVLDCTVKAVLPGRKYRYRVRSRNHSVPARSDMPVHRAVAEALQRNMMSHAA